MRKTSNKAQVGGGLRARVDPLAAASVSTTVRLPVPLAHYLAEMVSSGEAKDKTDAVVRCIRRHQETQAGVSDLGRLEAGQAELMARLGDVTDQLQGMRDDLVLVGSRSGDGLASLQQSIAALLSAGLYGDPGGGQETGSGGGPSAPTLPVMLMSQASPASTPAPTRRNKP